MTRVRAQGWPVGWRPAGRVVVAENSFLAGPAVQVRMVVKTWKTPASVPTVGNSFTELVSSKCLCRAARCSGDGDPDTPGLQGLSSSHRLCHLGQS